MYQLEVAEKMKNILICSISHEFRSPVNHINGILEILETACSKNERICNFIRIARSSVEMLTSKIDDILDYALLETNTLTLKPVEFNIRLLLKEIEKILNLQFDHKILNFSIFVAKDVPEIIIYDYKRIKQILLNLVFNALKHTEKGYVSVIVD